MANKAYGGPDERVRYALQALGLEYEVSDDGGFSLEFALNRGRSQLVFISSETTRVGKLELRRVYACGYKGSEAVPAGVNGRLLVWNGQVPIGGWISFEDEGEEFLLFQARIPADLEAESLREVLVQVAESADQLEEQLGGGDSL